MDDEHDNADQLGPQLSDELKQFAVDLAHLGPREDRLDRERLAFLAGQASVANESVRPLTIFGLPLESRTWPAAFAGMSAVAATLLVALLLRLDGAGLHPVDTNVAHDESNQNEDEVRILTTRDAHLGGLQSRMAKWSHDRSGGDTTAPFSQVNDSRILTPNGWHGVLKSSAPKPSTDDSSNLIHARGITL